MDILNLKIFPEICNGFEFSNYELKNLIELPIKNFWNFFIDVEWIGNFYNDN